MPRNAFTLFHIAMNTLYLSVCLSIPSFYYISILCGFFIMFLIDWHNLSIYLSIYPFIYYTIYYIYLDFSLFVFLTIYTSIYQSRLRKRRHSRHLKKHGSSIKSTSTKVSKIVHRSVNRRLAYTSILTENKILVHGFATI